MEKAMFPWTQYYYLHIWAVIWKTFGILMIGSVFAYLFVVIMNKNVVEQEFRRREDAANAELEQYGQYIPEDLQERIKKYFAFRWVNQEYGDLTLLNPQYLSKSLVTETSLCLYQDAIRNLPFLKKAPAAVLAEITQNLHSELYMQYDVI